MSETSNDDPRRLSTEIAELRKLFADKLTNDQVREKAFDQLYVELKQYKDDFQFQSEKPLLLDLLLFYDSLNWFQETLVKGEMSPDTVADSFQYLIDEFVEILYRRDVTPMEPQDAFDRKVHKVVRIDEVDDNELDWKIAQILKRGFVRGDKLLRTEDVVVTRSRKKK